MAGRISMSSIITRSGSSFMQTYSEKPLPCRLFFALITLRRRTAAGVISVLASLMSRGEKSSLKSEACRGKLMMWRVHFNIKGTHVLETCCSCKGGDLGEGRAAAAQSDQIFEGGKNHKICVWRTVGDVGEKLGFFACLQFPNQCMTEPWGRD